MSVIDVTNLHKRYGDLVAVDDLSLSIEEGEIFGVVGPNGAGKTTLVETIQGLRRPDSGSVRVLGLDPIHDRVRVRRLVGSQLQSSQLPDLMKVWEALDLYASFYPEPADWRALAEQVGLTDKLRSRFGKLSGGQRQRLSIALALIGNPKIAVLDELTTGLDPQARRDTWQLVREVRDRGVTVVLVTHFMDEAERLCDRLAVVARGRLLTIASPAQLVASAHVPGVDRPTLEDAVLGLTNPALNGSAA